MPTVADVLKDIQENYPDKDEVVIYSVPIRKPMLEAAEHTTFSPAEWVQMSREHSIPYKDAAAAIAKPLKTGIAAELERLFGKG